MKRGDIVRCLHSGSEGELLRVDERAGVVRFWDTSERWVLLEDLELATTTSTGQAGSG
jgi:hypothetical protein